MPIYEYRCEDCGQHLTLLRNLSEKASPFCVNCGSENVVRLISEVSVIKSEKERIRDLSWVDRDLAKRIRKKADGRLNPSFNETLDWMKSSG